MAALAIASHLTKALEQQPAPEFLATPDALKAYVAPKLDYLYTARPTAVNLGAATRRLTKTLNNSIAEGKDARTIARDLVAEGKAIDGEDVERNKRMGKWGGEWLVEETKKRGGSGDHLNVMTVCNTGSLATSVCDHFAWMSLIDPFAATGLRNCFGAHHVSTRDWQA